MTMRAVAIGSFCIALALGSAAAGENTPEVPQPRAHHQLAYNDSDGRIYLMGDGTMTDNGVESFSDMWTWSLGQWNHLPEADLKRAAHRLVYSPLEGSFVIFGGMDGGDIRADPALRVLGEDHAWRKIARNLDAAAGEPGVCYDRVRDTIVTFAGSAPGRGIVGQLHEWNGDRFTQKVIDDEAPEGRIGHIFTWDPVTQSCLLFGGRIGTGQLMADTWTWDGNVWTRHDVEGPSARFLHTATSDAANSRLVVFGGQAAEEKLLGDTWAWDGSVWSKISDTGPSPRMMGQMAAFEDGVLLFGGRAANPDGAPLYRDRNDTWLLADGHWSEQD